MYSEWDPNPGHQLVRTQEIIQKGFVEQAKPNPVLQQMNFKPANRPIGDDIHQPDCEHVNAPIGVINLDMPRKKKSKDDGTMNGAATIFWLLVIMAVIGWLAG